MLYRIVSVLLLFLSGCATTQTANIVTAPPAITLAPLVNNIVVPLGVELVYVAPDPDSRWTIVGQDLQAIDSFTTQIEIDTILKPEDDTPFSAMLPTLTAASLEIQENDGVQYAEGTTPITDYVLYVDKGEYVMTFTLIDAASDIVRDVYVEDWHVIGIEGELIVLE
ncbi:MAG: hypothetical protein Q9P44_18840 [Anaerolineae bacterium]|nr:hypothetical protein [Anaerolineae bacterium]